MSTHQEIMELSKTISCLALANQQLATAHNLTLGHVQWLLGQTNSRCFECAEKCSQPKVACRHCALNENERNKSGKTRVVLRKPNITVKATNKKARRYRKLPVLIESQDDEGVILKINEIEDSYKREIEQLNILNSEAQTKNDRLMNDLEEQSSLIERLRRDFENSQQECRTKERNLEEMSQNLNKSERESARLLAELETFQSAKTIMERTARMEAEQNASLRTRLSEQDEERKRQSQSLDEAAEQIRTLELALQANSPSSRPISQESTESDGLADSQPSDNAMLSTANEEFKRELTLKREARQRAIAAISSEMDRLRQELEAEKAAHSETSKQLEKLKECQEKLAIAPKTEWKSDLEKTDEKTLDRLEALRLSDLLKVSDEITSDLWHQLERTDDLRFQLENEPEEHRLRIASLRWLSEETRTVLRSRKQQVGALKDRLAQILVRLGDRCFLNSIDDVKEEVDRQIEDIARTRNLCDERSRILAELKDHSFKEIRELRLELDAAKRDKQCLEEELRKSEEKVDAQDAEIMNLESQLGLAKADCRDLQNQTSVINSLFTQMLLGASSAEMDLDRLTQLLQENHDLISGVAKENGTEAAALPKLLLDIIEQVDGRSREFEEKKEEDDLQEHDIAHNLPKVWRVLLELLSCHVANSSSASPAEPVPDSCYKSVDTPAGPRLVISVSKTYIRLKELILEKKHLEKEMNRMKQLNTHLESKLSEQEKRLSTVSDELSKTWNIVARMQAQHQQLHTHEKILRYELQQKRKMLQELKKELEYCKEKWESARQKNTNTELEWKSLRREFAARKALVTHDDSFNNSGESGFSDEREESDEDEDEGDVGKRIRPIPSRRRSRKDGSRAISPDTESELPTDTELSESKTVSSISGQRTPTPETEAELEGSEIIIDEDGIVPAPVSDVSKTVARESLDPLDRALSTVIEDLVNTNELEYANASSSENESNVETLSNADRGIDTSKVETGADRELKFEPKEQLSSPLSVFSIGPVPGPEVTVKNVQFSSPLIIGPSSIFTGDVNAETRSLATSNDESSKAHCSFTEANDASTATHLVDSSSNFETIKGCSKSDTETSVTDTVEGKSPTRSKTTESSAEGKEEIQGKSNESQSAEVLDARAARLRRLEEQTEWLVKKVSDTNRRSSVLNSRLEELHETYGSTPAAPPMPDILPTFRLQTVSESSVHPDTAESEESIKTNDSDEQPDSTQ